jgi:chaperonin GroEL (HSP60 family)
VIAEVGKSMADNTLPILRSALQAPARVILENAGIEFGPVIVVVMQSNGREGFDVQSGPVVNLIKTDIFNSLAVEKAIVRR